MQESVIFNSTVLLILYGIALFLAIIGLKNKKNCIMEFASAFVMIGTSVYAILCGASLYEVTIVVMIFLLIELFALGRKEP